MVALREAWLKALVESFGSWYDNPERIRDGQMSRKLYPYRMLFSPVQVNSLTLKNRIVMGPMGNVCMADETGRPGQKLVAYYAERAKGGVGLITSGLVPVDTRLDPSLTEPGELSVLPRIDRSRTVYAGWRAIADAVHAYGAHFFIQLTLGLGRVGSPECLIKKAKLPISASWNPNFYIKQIPCRPLTGLECRRLVRAAGQAAADARACAIDGVYLHGHEGYLLEQLTNPAFNHRRLGRYADWQAFGLDVVREVRKRCGAGYPIMYRIDLSLALRATYGERMDREPSLRRFRGERTVEMTLDYLRALVAAGVDMVDVDLGCYDNWWLPHPPGPMPPGCYLEVAQLVKENLASHGTQSNAGLPVPVVAVGKLGYPDLAERALREGQCDLVMLARPLLADPAWPKKAYAGAVSEIRPCIGDQEACLNAIVAGSHPQCAVNPTSGMEEIFGDALPQCTSPRRIAVIGAGPAGVVCATTAAQRGHQVTLFDRQPHLGGMLIPGSVPRIKFDVANYLAFLEHLVERVAQQHALALRLGVEVTPAVLEGEAFEAAVVCTGGQPVLPPIPGIDLPHVVHAVDLLRDPEPARWSERIVVVGGGEVGCETAFFLRTELQKEVTLVELLPQLMKGACSANRGYLLHYLETHGVALLNSTRVTVIERDHVTVQRNISPSVPQAAATWQVVLPENIKNPLARPLGERLQTLELPADLVVIAAGYASDDRLYRALIQAGAISEVQRIGDAFHPGNVFAATRAGYTVGRAL